MSVCGLAHMYSDSLCGLPAGHDDHVAHTDGIRAWRHHEDVVAEDDGRGNRVYDVWDEDVEDAHA